MIKRVYNVSLAVVGSSVEAIEAQVDELANMVIHHDEITWIGDRVETEVVIPDEGDDY